MIDLAVLQYSFILVVLVVILLELRERIPVAFVVSPGKNLRMRVRDSSNAPPCKS